MSAVGAWRRWALLALPPLLALPAIWLLLSVSLLASDDGLNHVNRQVSFDELLRQGVLFPRLYPDLASGYGYPLGSFYPPLSLYVAEAPLLFGGGPPAGVRLSLALALLVAAAGAFGLGRALSGRIAGGVLAGAAYLFAPYLLAVVYVRGAMAEAWALAILPWVFWSLLNWRGAWRGAVWPALALAALLLAHNLIALFGWPLAALWWVVLRRGAGWQTLFRGALPFALALGLTAFYWLPALVEAGAVSLNRFSGKPLDGLIGLDRLVDIGPVFGGAGFRLGLVQVMAAGAGLATALALRRLRAPALFGAAAMLTVAVGISVVAAPFWGLGLLDAVQFPFRLLGPAALLGAVAATPLALLRTGPVVAAIGALLLGAGGLAGLPVASREADPALFTPGGVARWEFVDRSVGTTISQEYLPAGVAWRWPADGFVTPPDTRADPAFPEAQLLRFGPYGIDLALRAERATPLRLHAFALPGWSATVDGAPATIRETGPLRLLTVEVPAGDHLLAIRYGTTPARMAGLAIAALTGLSLAAVALPLRRLSGRLALATIALGLVGIVALSVFGPGMEQSAIPAADLGPVRLLGGLVERSGPADYRITLYWQSLGAAGDLPLGVRIVASDGAVASDLGRPVWATSSTAWWMKNEVVKDVRTVRLPPGFPAGPARLEAVAGGEARQVGTVEIPGRPDAVLPAALGRAEGIALIGARLPGGRTVAPGATVEVELDWAADAQPADDYALLATLLGPAGEIVDRASSDLGNGLGPTSLWRAGDRRTTRHRLRLPANAESGRYQVQVGLRPFRTNPDQTAVAGLALLPPLKLPEPPVDLKLRAEPRVPFGDLISLVGYDVTDEGDTLLLVWEARRDPERDYTVFVHLLDGSGRLIAQRDSPPRSGGYPTSLWSVGERIADRVPLPDAPGVRTVRVGLYDPATGVRLRTPTGDSVEFPFAP